MPQMKGTEFLARARELCPGSIRVLLTGHAGIDAAISAINEQLLERYLTKPINNESDFLININQLLQQFDMRQLIVDQDRVIRKIYTFSNSLNSLDDLSSTLRCVTGFTRGLFDCRHSMLLLNDYPGPGLPPLSKLGEAGEVAACLSLTEEQSRRLLETPLAWTTSTPGELPWLTDSGIQLTGPTAYTALASGTEILGILCVSGPERGSFEEREIRSLIHIADTAAIALRNQYARTRLETAYAESTRQSDELARMNTRLQILDRLKGDFLTFISHELRTPLSLLMPVTFLEQCNEPEQRAELVRVVNKGYTQLEKFVTQGLEYFSWLSREKSDSPEATDLTDVVRAAAARITPELAPGMAVELSLPDGPCEARIPRRFIEQILEVFIANAIKFSEEDPWIRLQVSAGSKGVVVSVEDRGMGFPPELARELFSPFTIADTLHHRSGHAMSLALAAAIAESHGARIVGSSPGPGRGAIFAVEFPADGSAGASSCISYHSGVLPPAKPETDTDGDLKAA